MQRGSRRHKIKLRTDGLCRDGSRENGVREGNKTTNKELKTMKKRKPVGPNAHLFPGKQIWTPWEMLKDHLVILSSRVEKV